MVAHTCDLSTWQEGREFEASLDYLGKPRCSSAKKLDMVGGIPVFLALVRKIRNSRPALARVNRG